MTFVLNYKYEKKNDIERNRVTNATILEREANGMMFEIFRSNSEGQTKTNSKGV